MPHTIDPVFTPETLRTPDILQQVFDDHLGALPQLQLTGKVDSNPKTAAIILAGGTGERFGRESGQAHPHLVC